MGRDEFVIEEKDEEEEAASPRPDKLFDPNEFEISEESKTDLESLISLDAPSEKHGKKASRPNTAKLHERQ